MLGKARTGALLVLPLAAAVQQAQATPPLIPTLPTGNFSCSTSNGGCVSGGDFNEFGTGLKGVGFYADFPITFNGSSYVDFSSSGLMTGPSGGGLAAGSTVASGYNFTISNVSGGGFDGGTWSLMYEILDTTTGQTALLDNSHSGGGAGLFSASFTDQLLFPLTVGDNLIVMADLTLTAGPSGGFYSVSIPSNFTFDIGTSATAAAAPEPSTLSFGGLALAIAGVWSRLRRRRTADLQ